MTDLDQRGATGPAIYRGMDRPTLDAAYNNSTCLSQGADHFGFDREAVFVGGWSAGGHLTAAVADHPFFRGGLPISGIFDLEPIALNYLNEKLSLDAIEIATLSPLRTFSNRRPLRLAVGGSELPELKRQSEAFAAAATPTMIASRARVRALWGLSGWRGNGKDRASNRWASAQEIEVGLMGDNPRLDPIHRDGFPLARAEGAPPPPLRLSNFGPTSCGLRPRRQPNPFISSPTH
jgi:acetyl esterase/lipase